MNWADPVLPFHLGAYAGLLGLGLWLSRRRKACISGRRVVVVPDIAPRSTVDLGRELPRIFARAALPEPSVPAGAPLLNPWPLRTAEDVAREEWARSNVELDALLRQAARGPQQDAGGQSSSALLELMDMAESFERGRIPASVVSPARASCSGCADQHVEDARERRLHRFGCPAYPDQVLRHALCGGCEDEARGLSGYERRLHVIGCQRQKPAYDPSLRVKIPL